ncbi:MAG TPA: flagellar basal body-associated FliL family protein [Burkholderiaceae bacterium]|nr:flagellar basal body-associated FliL family protein [Burkholderiaceae bacterium]
MSTSAATLENSPPKRSKRWILFALLALIAVGAIGAGAWWYLDEPAADDPAALAKAAEKRKREHVFVTLEPFVVNLSNRDSERYAQIGVVLEVDNKRTAQSIDGKMPAVRNAILLLISSKTSLELIPRAGKEQLAAEIQTAASSVLGWAPAAAAPTAKPAADKGAAKSPDAGKPRAPGAAAGPPPPVVQVHFSSFIVQ